MSNGLLCEGRDSRRRIFDIAKASAKMYDGARNEVMLSR